MSIKKVHGMFCGHENLEIICIVAYCTMEIGLYKGILLKSAQKGEKNLIR